MAKDMKKNISRIAIKLARGRNTSKTYRRRSRSDAVAGQATLAGKGGGTIGVMAMPAAATTWTGKGGGTIWAMGIRAAKTKHGPRGNWRELEFAQFA